MQSTSKGRDRRNWKRWALISLAVGAVVYLAVFLLMHAGGGSGGSLY
jgi:hypothetical protein